MAHIVDNSRHCQHKVERHRKSNIDFLLTGIAIKSSVSIGDALLTGRFHSPNKMASTSFWTPERIARAVPITIQHRGDPGRPTALYAPVQKVISNEERVKPPYSSVGLLLYTVRQEGHVEYYRSTAFATNASEQNNVVFTAAHSLVGPHGIRENISFMPAIRNDRTKPFGEFKQIEGGLNTAFFVHPKYDGSIAYDLGAVKLQTNEDGKNLGDVVTPLDITKDQTYSEATFFKAVGYFQGEHGEEIMMENMGNFYKKDGEIIYKLGQLYPGCSGGPWFLNESAISVNGNTSTGHEGQGTTPYYSGEKIQAVVDQLSRPPDNNHRQTKSWLCCFK